MKKFMGKDFLLDNETAKLLYHNYAEKLPIIDYHCHVPPKEIEEDKRYDNITELWLGGDHYKWRAMRSCGIDEKYITGDASDYEKFRAYVKCMPRLIGNPLYHWSHLELRRYFGYTGIICEKNCDEIWQLTSERLKKPYMSVRNIIKASNVDIICTTDDPADTLESHDRIASDSDFDVKVFPAFRPDKGINIDRDGWRDYINLLSAVSGVEITGLDSLKEAYRNRISYFAEHGCRTADHGIDNKVPFIPERNMKHLDEIVKSALTVGKCSDAREAEIFKTEMHRFLASEYTTRGWVMQIHYGVLRNSNSVMFEKLGADSGFDIIDGRTSTSELAGLLDWFAERDGLPRIILYSINPADNAAVGTLLGGFQMSDGSGMPRIMQGSAWWFNDNKNGMETQMVSLANLSAFGCFTGMLTDSRSFLSYTRHEYFRRILCNLIGGWVEKGEYPADIDSLAELVINICYNNAKRYFGF